MPRTHADRLRALVARIEVWEDNGEPDGARETAFALQEAEELILDIQQCLESILLEEPAWVINRNDDIEPAS